MTVQPPSGSAPGAESVVRRADSNDVDALLHLAPQLFHVPNRNRVVERQRVQRCIDRAASATDEEILVALDTQGRVVGYAEVRLESGIASDGGARLMALVVDEALRSRGHGAALVRACEAWARARGCPALRLTSRAERSRAHAFYLREGFTLAKLSHFYAKSLDPPS